MINGIPIYINPFIQKGTVWIFNRDKPDCYIMADCPETVEKLVAETNEVIIKETDVNFLEQCGIKIPDKDSG